MIEFQLAKLRKLFFQRQFSKSGSFRAGKKIGNKQKDQFYDQVKIVGSSFHFGNKSFKLFPFIYDLVSREVTNKASCQHLLAIWPYFPTYVHNYTRRRQQGTEKPFQDDKSSFTFHLEVNCCMRVTCLFIVFSQYVIMIAKGPLNCSMSTIIFPFL